MAESIADVLDAIFDELHAIEAQMRALPDLDEELGVPNNPDSATGQQWNALFEKHTALARRAARLVNDHIDGSTYPNDHAKE